MALTKQQLDNALAFKVGSVPYLFSTTSAGDSTSVISTTIAGFGDDFFIGWYVLITSGNESVKWRLVTDYVSSTGDLTVAPALAGAPGTPVTCELHTFSPALYTLASNDAIKDIAPTVMYPLRNWGGIIVDGSRTVYPVPREFVQVTRVFREVGGSRIYYDTFDRADSTTLAGNSDSGHAHTAQAGTWGISSDKLYSASDADANLLTADPDEEDGFFQATVSGTLNHATIIRTPDLIFHFLNTSNYLAVQLLNGSVLLIKIDGGSPTTLATATQTTANGTDYIVRVEFVGARIKVYVDEVELINYELLGTDLKYRDYTIVGYRLTKGGSPATAARWHNAKMHKPVALVPLSNNEVMPDGRTIRFGSHARGIPSPGDNTALIVEGWRYLTPLTDDSTTGTLDSFTTAKVELTLQSVQTDFLLARAAFHLYNRLLNPVLTRNPEDRAEYGRLAQNCLIEIERLRPFARMDNTVHLV